MDRPFVESLHIQNYGCIHDATFKLTPLHAERGKGLAAIYDAIMVRDLPTFINLNEKLSELFPSVKGISLINPTSSTKAMGVKLVDGTFVPTELMSEGLLYYLAFAAIPQ